MELTLVDAKAFLTSLGIALPDVFLQLIVDQINSIDACLAEAGYDLSTAGLIKYYALALLGIMQPNQYVTQQRAPSGASRSFSFGTLDEGYKKYIRLLQSLDANGCTAGIIPENPNALGAALFVGMGDWPDEECI